MINTCLIEDKSADCGDHDSKLISSRLKKSNVNFSIFGRGLSFKKVDVFKVLKYGIRFVSTNE